MCKTVFLTMAASKMFCFLLVSINLILKCQCSLIHVSCTSDLVSFLNLPIYSFYQIWKILAFSSSNIFPCVPFSSLSAILNGTCMRLLEVLSQFTDALLIFLSPFSLCLISGIFHCYFFYFITAFFLNI